MAYTDIDDSSAYLQVKTFTGDGNTSRSLTFDGNSDLKPTIMWTNKRSGGGNYGSIMAMSHPGLTDHDTTGYKGLDGAWIRVTGKYWTNDSNRHVSSFNTDGFTTDTYTQNYYVNESGDEFVSWAFGGDNKITAANDTNGDITSSVLANTKMGMSFVKWTGNGSQEQDIGHGLGKRPNHIMMFPIEPGENNGNTERIYWHEANAWNHVIKNELNASEGAESDSTKGRLGASASNNQGTSTTFNVFSGGSPASYRNVNLSGGTYMAVCWTSIQGFSKFGSYVGNGNANGPFVYCGFRPKIVQIRRLDGAGYRNYDTERDPINPASKTSNWVDNNGAELSDGNTPIDILSNGFKIRHTHTTANTSGNKYLFSAWAENPFVTSTGTPTTAR